MAKFNVTGNINHDQKDYKAGDVLELTEEQALALIEAGVLEDPNADEKEVATDKPTPRRGGRGRSKPKADEPEVGGSKNETGEPSVDGEESKQDDAEDVTPEVEEAAKDL